MKTRILNYLRFTRAERNGSFALLLLAVLLFAAPEIARRFRPQKITDFSALQTEIQRFRASAQNAPPPAVVGLFVFDPNTATLEDFVRLGLSEKVANVICNYRNKGGKFRQPTDFQKIWSLSKPDFERLLPYIQIESGEGNTREKWPEKAQAELFAFDPNSATGEDLLRLGLPERTVKSLLNYRAKGGKFRKTADLEKIYTLSEADFARIAPFATFSEALAAQQFPAPVAYAGGQPAEKMPAKGPVDINRASVESWRTLPGIGEHRARQLVNYREKLGGFQSVEQVREMYGMPDSVFQNIRASLMMGAAELRKINLNTASVADLDAHPYISKRQAELIVAYREQHGAFAAAADIGKMRAISDQAWLAKVTPYLGVE